MIKKIFGAVLAGAVIGVAAYAAKRFTEVMEAKSVVDGKCDCHDACECGCGQKKDEVNDSKSEDDCETEEVNLEQSVESKEEKTDTTDGDDGDDWEFDGLEIIFPSEPIVKKEKQYLSDIQSKQYYLNKKSRKFHKADCQYCKPNPDNGWLDMYDVLPQLKWVSNEKVEYNYQRYEACGYCQPWFDKKPKEAKA